MWQYADEHAIKAFTEDGQSEKALKLFDGITLFGIQPDVTMCGAVLDACAKSGWGERANAFLNRMELNQVAVVEP